MKQILFFDDTRRSLLRILKRLRWVRLFLLAVLACIHLSAAPDKEIFEAGQSPENLHIYLLIGQSNMAGRAPIADSMTEVSARCFLLNAAGEWERASHPFNQYSSIRKKIGMQRLNPGYSFAKKMLAANPDINIGLIVNAKGGTRIDQWLGASELYESIRGRAQAFKGEGLIKGILWHQGESDSRQPDGYLEKLKKLIAQLREDLDAPNLPFVAGQIHNDPPQAINAAIAQLPEELHMTAVVSSKG